MTSTSRTHSPADLAARRQFLRRGAALAAGAFGATSLGQLLLNAKPAYAADYKALVCIFQYGGSDGMNMVVPSDATRHGQYAGVRGALALPRGGLASLTGSDYGLHPAMASLLPFWNQSQLAPVFNLGPLHQPLTKAQYLAAGGTGATVPASLFSHSDQQRQWESAVSDSLSRTGWAGRASNALSTINPTISVGGNGLFGVEDLRSPLVLPGPGSGFGAYGLMPQDQDWEPNRLRKAAVDALYAEPQGNAIATAFADQQRVAFEMSNRLSGIVGSLPGDAMSVPAIDAAFAPLITDGYIYTWLGQQMYQLAKLIAYNATVQGNRQIFFATHGGYDNHNGQVGGSPTTGPHAELLGELADAMACFQTAMNSLGLGQAVTVFTQSDFGRTFAPNETFGTDHAWGNHHLVMGGAVKGKKTYGAYPTLVLGGPDDVGVEEWELQGRWIPTSSVDQYAATLLSWFGASASQLDAVLPNLVNFGSNRTLGFL